MDWMNALVASQNQVMRNFLSVTSASRNLTSGAWQSSHFLNVEISTIVVVLFILCGKLNITEVLAKIITHFHKLEEMEMGQESLGQITWSPDV